MTELDDVSSLPSSRRTAGDTWAITESVGATALGVAAARAVETAATNPLIRDEFAKVLVSSAGTAWARLADADLAWLDGDQLGRRVHRVACDYQAVRTHFFDEYFGAAVDAGVRQVVILAAGLDARAYRLNWPAGTVVYEIDQPSVLEYKAGILQSHGAVPTARRHAVAVTTFVGAVSEIMPLRTEAMVTDASAGVDMLEATPDKRSTTVAMDFGRITLGEDLVLYLFGTPGQRRFWFMWDDLVRGAIGAIVLVDCRRLQDSFAAVDFFEHRNLPFLIAINEFDSAPRYPVSAVRDALTLPAHIPVINVDARNRRSATDALIAVSEYALATLSPAGG